MSCLAKQAKKPSRASQQAARWVRFGAMFCGSVLACAEELMSPIVFVVVRKTADCSKVGSGDGGADWMTLGSGEYVPNRVSTEVGG